MKIHTRIGPLRYLFGESGIEITACACSILHFTVLEWSVIGPDEDGNHVSNSLCNVWAPIFLGARNDFLCLPPKPRYCQSDFFTSNFVYLLWTFFPRSRLFTHLWWTLFPWTFSPSGPFFRGPFHLVDLFSVDVFT